MTDNIETVIVNNGGVLARLTAEQARIMRMIETGMTYRQIGTVLNMSHSTVKYRMARLCDALGARNRVEALTMWLRGTM